MRKSQDSSGDAGEKLKRNLARIEDLNRRFVEALSRSKPDDPGMLGPGEGFYAKAASAGLHDAIANPARLLERQVGHWSKSLKLWMDAQAEVEEGGDAPQRDSGGGDRRFRDDLWDAHPYFRLVKDQYLLNSELISSAVREVEGLDERDRSRLEFFARQFVDMMSPANFLGTNPEALARAVETEGESLVRGLENLVADLERNDGELSITLSDPDAFKVGGNLATTEGSVVFRNRLFELIQYAPRTEEVKRTPLLIVPPWINKYYILDLKPRNSFIRWAVDQGLTVFVVSWINPGPELRDVGMDAYAEEGCLTAVREVLALTGESQVNAVGYCIGGTLLALVLAYMSRTGDKSVRSATFLTTLTDFEDIGELSVFVQDDFLAAIEREVEQKGYLPSVRMSRTFSYMRANDLIYGPAIRSYMMGEPPPAFDLLYWNGDSTNLPARMTIEYLRGLCLDNEFSKGRFRLLGKTVSLSDVRHPLFAVACETDHIAVWRSSLAGVQMMRSRSKTFVLSQSGHIAGIINPADGGKYGHYTHSGTQVSADEWLSQSELTEGSWWTRWGDWIGRRSGGRVPARTPGDQGNSVLCAAPGTYVKGSVFDE